MQERWRKNLIISVVSGLVVTVVGGYFLSLLTGHESSNSFSDVKDSVVNVDSDIENQTINYSNTEDPSFENPRAEDLQNLSGHDIIAAWFQLLDESRWQDACSLFAKDKCNVRDGNEVNDQVHEYRFKTVDGYHVEDISHSEDAPDNIWCVKYSYQEKQSVVPRVWTLLMQYTLVDRSDGAQDIGPRLCEKEWAEGLGERACTATPSVYYCR